MYIGEVIRCKRQMQALSVRKLAKFLGVDDSILSRYETGKRNISKNHAYIIKSYLEGELDEQIKELIRDELKLKYGHLAGVKGLELWA